MRAPTISAPAMGDTRVSTVRRLAVASLWLVVWIYLYLIVLLGGWVTLSSFAGGWDPVVITSGSMEPTIRVGDILLLEEHPEQLLGQQAVLVVDRGESGTVAHRVFAVDDGEYVIKGDANPVPDTDRVAPENVVGVGRLVVPAIGLPIVWAQEGAVVPLFFVGSVHADRAGRGRRIQCSKGPTRPRVGRPSGQREGTGRHPPAQGSGGGHDRAPVPDRPRAVRRRRYLVPPLGDSTRDGRATQSG